ncbi:uncharacterized protein LOC124118725, partial [Xyrichtys novacula]
MSQVTSEEIHSLRSNQEERDTRIVIYCNHAAELGFTSTVVCTPDSDVLFILLYHAHNIKLTVYIDIGTGMGRPLVNVTQLANDLGSEYCETLLGYYVCSGEDCTSAFKGKGKVGPLKKLQKNPKYQAAFRELGVEWCLSSSCKEDLEHFTCLMYGHGREKKVDAVCVKMIRKMVRDDESLSAKSKVDLGRLPPPQCSLSTHLDRCNHRVACYKRAAAPVFERPKPYDPDQ